MSLEKNIERIADALGIIALALNDEVRGKAEAAAESETSASGRPKATRKKAAKKDEPTGPTREDVSDALVEFCKNGPGKIAAKEIFEEFKAGSISTLDVKTYEAFIARLNEVSGG